MAAMASPTAVNGTGGGAGQADTLEWKYVQSFGDDTASDGHNKAH